MSAQPQERVQHGTRSEETKRRHAETLQQRAAIQIENIEFLLSWGTAVWEIPSRVGHSSPIALEKFLYRQGRADLVAELRRRDPLTMNRNKTVGEDGL
ncbi:hypothetical protein ACX80I_01010 [Arthrobacter sp. MDT3-44]